MSHPALAIACLACVAACDRRAPITSCESDLTGEYTIDDRRWMILDHGARLEAFPLFPDAPAEAELEVAPRVIDLGRTAGSPQLTGEVRRRYMKATTACTAKLAARIVACTNESLDLVLGEPSPPLAFAPCTWPRPEPSRLERWIRR